MQRNEAESNRSPEGVSQVATGGAPTHPSRSVAEDGELESQRLGRPSVFEAAPIPDRFIFHFKRSGEGSNPSAEAPVRIQSDVGRLADYHSVKRQRRAEDLNPKPRRAPSGFHSASAA